MLGAKFVETPIEQNHDISAECEGLLYDIKSYQRLVGRLLYLNKASRDIACYLLVLTIRSCTL